MKQNRKESDKMRVSAVIMAAGKGERLPSAIPKQFIGLEGMPILARTIEKFQLHRGINEIIVVTRNDFISYCEHEIVAKYGFTKVSNVTAGGERRQDSVSLGLGCCSQNTDIVLIHDGVRPFITEQHITDVINGVICYGCCTLGVRVKDTIKISGANNMIASTPDRSSLWQIQTPQGFQYGLIQSAYKNADGVFTDDCSVAEHAGHKVYITEGSYFNIKITTKVDLVFAKAIFCQSEEL